MNKKTNKKTMRKYGKKGGLLPGLLNHALVINNAAHTPYPYTKGTGSTIFTNFDSNPLVTQYGEEEKPSVLDKYIDVTPSTGFIHITPPPPRKPGTGKKDVVDDNNKNNNEPRDVYINKVEDFYNKYKEREVNLHKNVKKAADAKKSNPNFKKGINF
jgi:hypothetical protein